MRNKFLKIILRLGHFLLITAVALVITLFGILKLITSNISVTAKELFVTTLSETGQLSFLATWLVSKEERTEIINSNSMTRFEEEENTDLINITEEDKNKDNIELIKIPGNSFAAKMLVIHDPSRIRLETIYPWRQYGVELDKLVAQADAIGGINGGIYVSAGNQGGNPLGVIVSDGEIQYNRPSLPGLHLIGLDENNLLRVIDLQGMNASTIEKMIKEEKIRDAVCFQEEASDSKNHFVKLVVNGKERELKGMGSGANPRTAIGQKEDGTILLLVTDGRGKDGHLGATAKDLIEIMMEYGAVNAANLDGGSSSSMFYKGVYEMPSITLYYSNSSWRLPAAFVIEKR